MPPREVEVVQTSVSELRYPAEEDQKRAQSEEHELQTKIQKTCQWENMHSP